MQTEVVDAKDAQGVIRNLFQLYAHELSDMAGIDIGEDGAFALPKSLDLYWKESERHPFLVHAEKKLTGFALVRAIDSHTFDMAEFFVLRKFRRAGVGKSAACALFDRFHGNWEVRELIANTPAQAFWRKIIGDYTHGDFEDAREFFPAYGREFVVQRFRSR